MILSRIRVLPQERFDLEDLNALMSAVRTDSKYNVKKLLANLNYVVNGFSVSGIGLKSATVNMTDGTLIIPQNSNDFSWYTTSATDPNVVIPDASLVDGTRNYVEMSLVYENGTPVTRAFWDPEANGGAGLEFNQTVDTITDLAISFVVLNGGFSGSPDRLPLAIIDTDVNGTITAIFDERILYHRLGNPTTPQGTFPWSSRTEPPFALTLNGVTGVFQQGEQIQLGPVVATVFTGGSSTISVQLPSSNAFQAGQTATGLTSGATGTIATISESFTGADKSIINLKQDLDAIKTEILALKTNQPGSWFQSTTSIVELQNEIASITAVLNAGSYDEDFFPPDDSLVAGSEITLPVNTRLSSQQQYYVVGKGALELWLNGQKLSRGGAGDDGWSEVGSANAASDMITINQDLKSTDRLNFRLGLGGATGAGSSSGGGAADDNFYTLPESTTPEASDYVLIYDTSISAYRKQLRSTFLAGVGGGLAVQTYATNHTADATNDDLLLFDCTTGNKTCTLPDPTTCNGKVFYFKKIDSSGNSLIVNGAGFNIDGQPSVITSNQYESTPLVADAANHCWWSI